MSIVGELKRRRVFQVAAVYAVVAWLLIQIITSIEEPLGLPGWVDTFVIVLVAIGFPIAVILSWAFDVTPEGIKTTKKADPGDVHVAPGATKFTYVVQVLVLFAVGFLIIDQYVLGGGSLRQNNVTGGASNSALVTRFDFELPVGQRFGRFNQSVLAISPNSRQFVYRARGGLFLRLMTELEPHPILARERLSSVVFSPDSESVAFWDVATEQLKRIAISGGVPIVIARDIKRPFGMNWGGDDEILYVQSEGVFKVAAGGDTPPELIIPVTDGRQAYGAQLLPDEDSVLFSLAPPGNWDGGEIVVETISTNNRKILVAGGTSAKYLPSGHLIYALGNQLFAIAFDLDSLSVFGRAIPVADMVIRGNAAWETGVAHYDVSDDGTLAYVAGDANKLATLIWVDRDGQETAIPIEAANFDQVKMSPNGSRVIINEASATNDILIWDFDGETTTRLDLGGTGGDWPVWTPDGLRVAYHPSVGDVVDWRTSNNIGSPERLVTGRRGAGSGTAFHPEDFSKSGDLLVFRGKSTSASGEDIGMVNLGDGSDPVWLLDGTNNEWGSDISPDDRWLAYHSDESGRGEVYVRPFPNIDDNRWQVSNRGGTHAVWSQDGRQLYYLEPGSPQRLISVDVERSETGFSFSDRTAIIDWPYYSSSFGQPYGISSDGERFFGIKPADDTVTPKIIIVQNWFEELKRLVPPKQ